MYIDITDVSRRDTTATRVKVTSIIVIPKVGEHKLELDVYTTDKEACNVLSRWSIHQELVEDGEYRFIIPAGLIVATGD